MRPSWLRYGPPGVLLAVCLLFFALYNDGPHPVYHRAMELLLVEYDEPPFADGVGLVSALECERLGYETYFENPCEPKGRAFVYPPIWKLGALLPVDAGWYMPVVALFITAYFAALACLPAAPDRRGALLMTLAMISPASIKVLQYGNNEMILFALAVTGAWLLQGGGRARSLTYATFLLAGLLKYFPFALMASTLREPPSRLLGWLVASLATVAIFAWVAGEQLELSLAHIPSMSALSYVFGVSNLSLLMVEISAVSEITGLAVRMVMTLALIATAFVLSRRDFMLRAIENVPAAECNFLFVGGLLTLGAYLAAQNVDYRQIHMLMALPALILISRDKALPQRLRQLPWLVVGLMWIFPVRYHLRALFEPEEPIWRFVTAIGIVIREIGWFAAMTTILSFLILLLRDAPVMKTFFGRGAAN